MTDLRLATASERLIVTDFDNKCHHQKQTCHFELDKLNIEILFSENIHYLKPFSISIKIKELVYVESILVDFKMKNMNMGVNHFKLKKIKSENKEQHWQGKAILPICVTRRAEWLSELKIVTKRNKYIFSFPISVVR